MGKPFSIIPFCDAAILVIYVKDKVFRNQLVIKYLKALKAHANSGQGPPIWNSKVSKPYFVKRKK